MELPKSVSRDEITKMCEVVGLDADNVTHLVISRDFVAVTYIVHPLEPQTDFTVRKNTVLIPIT
jgi:hypothetical protein